MIIIIRYIFTKSIWDIRWDRDHNFRLFYPEMMLEICHKGRDQDWGRREEEYEQKKQNLSYGHLGNVS